MGDDFDCKPRIVLLWGLLLALLMVGLLVRNNINHKGGKPGGISPLKVADSNSYNMAVTPPLLPVIDPGSAGVNQSTPANDKANR